jgi:hypothetical protein
MLYVKPSLNVVYMVNRHVVGQWIFEYDLIEEQIFKKVVF